jgi:hypothetical protein
MKNDVQQDAGASWMYYMRNGDFETAWKISDDVMQSRAGKPCWHLPRHYQYSWDGSPLEQKRVLVKCYHGLGDTIQFIRYAPLLNEVAAKVIVWAQEPLIPLLKTVEGIDELLPLHDGVPDVEYDVDVEVMELPHIFRSTIASLPVSIPYIHVEPLPLSNNKKHVSVGLVWKPGDWAPFRSIPFSTLEPLARVEGIQLYILQADAELAGWREGFGNHPGEFSLYDYARVIKGLDLLISVDSMPVHLAGALGVPVWTLLHAEADWRWMDNREDSPWYPTMHLFRQKQPGDWLPVIDSVCGALQTFVKDLIARKVFREKYSFSLVRNV